MAERGATTDMVEAGLDRIDRSLRAGTAIADAAASVRWPGGDAWVGGTDFSFIDQLFGAMLPLGRLPLRAGTKPLASHTDIFQDIYDNFSTIILATVFVGGWRANWAQSFVSLILASYTNAELLAMHAVKGGAACDCEISSIEAVMPALGFTTVKSRATPEMGIDKDGTHMWEEWLWSVERPNARPFRVQLERYARVGYCDADMVADDTSPKGEWNACAPNLQRVAAVSAPVVDKDDEPIAGRLNANLTDGLALGRARAAGIVPKDQKWTDLTELQRDEVRSSCRCIEKAKAPRPPHIPVPQPSSHNGPSAAPLTALEQLRSMGFADEQACLVLEAVRGNVR